MPVCAALSACRCKGSESTCKSGLALNHQTAKLAEPLELLAILLRLALNHQTAKLGAIPARKGSKFRLALNHQTAKLPINLLSKDGVLRLALNHQTAKLAGKLHQEWQQLRLALNHQIAKLRTLQLITNDPLRSTAAMSSMATRRTSSQCSPTTRKPRAIDICRDGRYAMVAQAHRFGSVLRSSL